VSRAQPTRPRAIPWTQNDGEEIRRCTQRTRAQEQRRILGRPSYALGFLGVRCRAWWSRRCPSMTLSSLCSIRLNRGLASRAISLCAVQTMKNVAMVAVNIPMTPQPPDQDLYRNW